MRPVGVDHDDRVNRRIDDRLQARTRIAEMRLVRADLRLEVVFGSPQFLSGAV